MKDECDRKKCKIFVVVNSTVDDFFPRGLKIENTMMKEAPCRCHDVRELSAKLRCLSIATSRKQRFWMRDYLPLILCLANVTDAVDNAKETKSILAMRRWILNILVCFERFMGKSSTIGIIDGVQLSPNRYFRAVLTFPFP